MNFLIPFNKNVSGHWNLPTAITMVAQEFTVDLNKPLVFQVSYSLTMP